MSKNKNYSFDDIEKVRFRENLQKSMIGETNSSFARKCGVSETMIRKYLNGDAFPRATTISKISEVTGKSIAWLLGEQSSDEVRVSNKNVEEEQCDKELNLLMNLFNYLSGDQKIKVLQQVMYEVSSQLTKHEAEQAPGVSPRVMNIALQISNLPRDKQKNILQEYGIDEHESGMTLNTLKNKEAS